MPNGWLVKTEPSTYSWDDLVRDKQTVWDGVRNPQALKYLAKIKQGDRVFVYHTGKEKAVIGVAKAMSDGYPDPEQDNPKLFVVDLAAVSPLPAPVTLKAAKAVTEFATFELVRLPRLSVMPVTSEQWKQIERMSRSA